MISIFQLQRGRVAALLLGAAAASGVASPNTELCASIPADASASGGAAGQKGQLQWAKTTAELTSKFGQKIIRTSYPFANRSNKPVSIVSIEPSCGCVTTQLEKLEFAPGETGDLNVTLDLAMDAAVGTQHRYLIVRTSEGPAITTLSLTVHEPEAVALSSTAVTWERGEAAQAKVVTLQAGEGVTGLTLSNPSGSNEDFTVALAPDVPGQSYRVSITPSTTSGPRYAQIRLLARSGAFERPVICKINLNVK